MCTTFINQKIEDQPYYKLLNDYSNLAQIEQGIMTPQLQKSTSETQLQNCYLDVYILRQIINTILRYEKDVKWKGKDDKPTPILYLPLRNQQLFNRINEQLSQFILERHLYGF